MAVLAFDNEFELIEAQQEQSDAPCTARQRMHLRPLEEGDRERIYQWLQDPDLVSLTFIVPGPNSSDRTNFSRLASDHYFNMLVQDPDRKTFAIVLDGAHVGSIGLKKIDLNRRSCEFFMEVGPTDLRGKGIGSAALSMVLDYAYFELGMQTVNLEVLEFNEGALKVYERLGFEHIGRLGWHFDIANEYRQVLGMRMQDVDWFFQREKLRLSPEYVLDGMKL